MSTFNLLTNAAALFAPAICHAQKRECAREDGVHEKVGKKRLEKKIWENVVLFLLLFFILESTEVSISEMSLHMHICTCSIRCIYAVVEVFACVCVCVCKFSYMYAYS